MCFLYFILAQSTKYDKIIWIMKWIYQKINIWNYKDTTYYNFKIWSLKINSKTERWFWRKWHWSFWWLWLKFLMPHNNRAILTTATTLVCWFPLIWKPSLKGWNLCFVLTWWRPWTEQSSTTWIINMANWKTTHFWLLVMLTISKFRSHRVILWLSIWKLKMLDWDLPLNNLVTRVSYLSLMATLPQNLKVSISRQTLGWLLGTGRMVQHLPLLPNR